MEMSWRQRQCQAKIATSQLKIFFSALAAVAAPTRLSGPNELRELGKKQIEPRIEKTEKAQAVRTRRRRRRVQMAFVI